MKTRKESKVGFPRRTLSALLDVAVTVLAYPLALALRTGMDNDPVWDHLERNLLLLTAISVPLLLLLAPNSSAWRYFSLREAFVLLRYAVGVVMTFAIAVFLVDRGTSLPRAVPVIMLLLILAGSIGVRAAYRLFRDGRIDGYRKANGGDYALLYGFSDDSELLIRSLRRDARRSHPMIVGIVDDRRKNRYRRLHNVPVVGGIADLDDAVQMLDSRGRRPSHIILPGEQVDREILQKLLDAAVPHNLKIERLSSRSTPDQAIMREIRLEDLVGRASVQLSTDQLREFVGGRRVLITGAGGSIGSELSRQVLSLGPSKLVVIDNNELALYAIEKELSGSPNRERVVATFADVREAARIRQITAEHRPEIVFHAAAMKHVPIVEAQPLEGMKTNILGTVNAARAAIEAKAQAFVMVSTDKAVNPSSLMGLTKRFAEAYCQALDLTGSPTRFVTVRFGNVLNSNGSVVPLFRQQIARGGPVTVTHPDMTRYFMSIPEAVGLVLQASAHAVREREERGGIFVLDMGEPVKIVDLARRLIQLAGKLPSEIPIIFTGLRDGEKLYEELFEMSEHVRGTAIPGVMTASPRTLDMAHLDRILDALSTRVDKPEEMIALMREVVPEYLG